jgi:3-isopropylmalate dehydratase small subunit
MQAFTQLRGRVAAMDRADVDTDQIIPKQFLKRIERTGFEDFLFFDWRFAEDGSERPEFELNQPAARGAAVLLARRNFGCGSSREHAVWASSLPASPISSTTTASRTACCRSPCPRRTWISCFRTPRSPATS